MTINAKVFAAIAGVLTILDQWTKYLAVGSLTNAFDKAVTFGDRLVAFQAVKNPYSKRVIAVIDDFWHFRYAENTGAAFSFLADAPEMIRRPFFLIVSIVAMVGIVWYFKKTPIDHHVTRISLALVFGGAIGNFIDRVRLGYVIDFILWHWYDKASWPTFNVADSAISVGVVLLLLVSFIPVKASTSQKGASKA